ncbi:MAG: type II secretion system protein GspD [Bacteroidia bacterium]
MIKKIGIIVFVLLAFVSNAQDRFAILEQQLFEMSKNTPGLSQKLEMSVNNTPIQDFIRGIGISHSLNVTVDPNVDIKINNNFAGVTVQEVFLFLCKKYDLDLNFIGPIISFSKYIPPVNPVKVVTRKVNVNYNVVGNLLSMDLVNDTLSAVTKEITKQSRKNIVFSPDLSNKIVSGFVQSAPFDNALDKLAFANDLKITLSPDSFYLIEKAVKTPVTNNNGQSGSGLVNNGPPKSATGLTTNYTNGLLTVEGQNVPISDIVSQVSGILKQDYFLFNELKGNTTVSVKDVSYDDFLKILFNGTSYTFKKDGGIYLFGDRNIEGLRVNKLVQLKNRTISKITDFLPAELKKDVDIKVFPDLNGLILSGSQPRINEIQTFLREIDLVVPVVYIEVMIVDVQNSNTFAAGISAGLGSKPATTGGSVIPVSNYTLNANSINNIVSSISSFLPLNLGMVTPNFYATINAMESQGIVKIRSTPQLATLNGSEAKMSIGQQEYYLEVNNSLVQNVGNNNILQAQNYKSVSADLAITIDPQVSGDEQVTLKIGVKQSSFTARISPTAPPGTITRDFQSTIRVKNGEMIMLGGLEDKQSNETGSGLPLLSRIPVIKWFFSNRTRAKKDNKLTVFIRPTIIYG